MSINISVRYPHFENENREFFTLMEGIIYESCTPENLDHVCQPLQLIGVDFTCSNDEAVSFVNNFFINRQSPLAEQGVDMERVFIYCNAPHIMNFYHQLCVQELCERMANVERMCLKTEDATQQLKQQIDSVAAINTYTGLNNFAEIVNAITEEMERHGMAVQQSIGEVLNRKSH